MCNQYENARSLISLADMFYQLQAVVHVIRDINLNKNSFDQAKVPAQVRDDIEGVDMAHIGGDKLIDIVDQRFALNKMKRIWGLNVGFASCEKHIT